jgi:hypothetical protein
MRAGIIAGRAAEIQLAMRAPLTPAHLRARWPLGTSRRCASSSEKPRRAKKGKEVSVFSVLPWKTGRNMKATTRLAVVSPVHARARTTATPSHILTPTCPSPPPAPASPCACPRSRASRASPAPAP